MEYQQALIAARNGNAILFLGAGFSRNLYSVEGNKLPSSSELANKLCEKAEIRITNDLGSASKRYLKKETENSLIDILKSFFIVKNTPENYSSIFKCPWRQVYTTNYDNVFEVGSQNNDMLYQSVDLTENPRDTASKKRVVHINGFIGTVTPKNINTSFKLTNSSYLTTHFRDSIWAEVFRRDINSAHAVFFVGYSLYDIDIQEILFGSPEIRNKTFFIERENITEEEIEDLDLDSFGTILNIGASQFSNDLGAIDDSYIDDDELIITSFYEPKYENNEAIVQDSFIFDLLLTGDLNIDLLYNDFLSKKNRYCILREQFFDIVNRFENDENLIVHSSLANGKTIFSKQVSMYFFDKGYKIFEINDDYLENYAIIEVIKIIKKYEKVLFLIENYTKNINIVSHINSNRNEYTKIILISRTYEHERVANDLFYSKRSISIKNTSEISLDKLSDNDIENFSEYFNFYGVWGDMYGEYENKKIEFLRETANGEIHGILLGLLKSPQVAQRVNIFFSDMRSSHVLLINVVAILCLSMSNTISPTFHMVSALTDSNEIFNKEFRENDVFRQLTSRNNDTVIAKSSALAEFILTNFPNPPLLVQTLVSIAKNSRSKSNANKFYFDFYKDLASFRYIHNMLPKKGRRESLILFYQGLREIPEERNNPHFWLQYAIARLSYPDEENLRYAKSYLDNAMSLAKKRINYWTDDIETQLARYHFEKSISESNIDLTTAFTDFKQGVELIIKIYRSNNRPRKELFRPLKLTDNFYFKFKENLDEHQLSTTKNYLQLLDAIISKEENKYSNDIRFRMAKDAIKNTLKDILLTEHVSKNS